MTDTDKPTMPTPTQSPVESLIAQVLEAAGKATPGPWKSKLNHPPYKCVWLDARDNYATLELKAPDADFIALTRTAAPTLALMLREAIRQRDALLLRLHHDGNPITAADLRMEGNAALSALAALKP